MTLASAGPARGDGLPVVNLDTSNTGIASPDGSAHYYAVIDQDETTLLKVDSEPAAKTGETLSRLQLDGKLAIPGVAFDGTTSGISADGGRLALIEPRTGFPREQTRFVTVDTDRMEELATIDLRGDYSFDAISPNGLFIYLVHYIDPRDPTRYEVVAYDVAAERLRPEPILDLETAPIVMRGFPVTREASADGVWAYTLYTGGQDPFVHALDTADGSALCIDLASVDGIGNPYNLDLELSPDESELNVLGNGGTAATITTGSWEVNGAAPDPVASDQAAPDQQEDESTVLLPLGGGIAGLGALAIALGFARRRRLPGAAGPGFGRGTAG